MERFHSITSAVPVAVSSAVSSAVSRFVAVAAVAVVGVFILLGLKKRVC